MVRAAQHADIILSSVYGSDASPNIEIFLGNENNRRSDLFQSGINSHNNSLAFVLSEFEMKNFVISWEGNTVVVTRPPAHSPLLNARRSENFTINAFGVRTR